MNDPLCLRAGGEPVPLFFVHDDASVRGYVDELNAQVDSGVAIRPVSPASVGATRLTTLEGIATLMARAIRVVQPAAPYRVAGLSSAGMLAYEVATHLLGQEQDVAFLGVIGTRPHMDGESAAACDSALAVAASRYSPQPITVPVHLFADDRAAVTGRELAWTGTVANGLLRVVTVPREACRPSPREDARRLGSAIAAAMRNADDDARRQPSIDLRLIPLQSRPHRRPFCICIPGAGADVTSFIDIVSCLGETWSVYGLQPRGLDGVLVPHSTVQAAARAHIGAIEEAHLREPLLVGHSFGGWVAFEMACLLSEMGRTVSGVTLLDSEAPDAGDGVDREYTDIDCLQEWLDALRQRFDCRLRIDRVDLEARTTAQRTELLHRRLVESGLLPPQSGPGVLRGRLRTFFTNLRTHYCPKRQYGGPVTLVAADSPDLDVEGNRQRVRDAVDGWRRWAPNLHFLQAPGNHMTMLSRPHAEFVARVIRRHTSEAFA